MTSWTVCFCVFETSLKKCHCLFLTYFWVINWYDWSPQTSLSFLCLEVLCGVISPAKTSGIGQPFTHLHPLQWNTAGHLCHPSLWWTAALYQREWPTGGPQSEGLLPQHSSKQVRDTVPFQFYDSYHLLQENAFP